MQEWILPVLNIAVLIIIFWVSERNRQAKFSPFDYFADKSGGLRFAQERSRFADRHGVIYLFWNENCGHCRRLKDPAQGGKWPMFLTRAKNSNIPVQEIEMREQMTDSELAILKVVGPMPGVPYIVRITPGKAPEPYEGPRDDEALMRWALQVQ
jgi:hypothetical protein